MIITFIHGKIITFPYDFVYLGSGCWLYMIFLFTRIIVIYVYLLDYEVMNTVHFKWAINCVIYSIFHKIICSSNLSL